MKNKNAFNKFNKVSQGEKAINEIGHRRYVGGVGKNWHEIGMLQFKFLIANGLRPEHKFLDIACGSLRAGIHIIPYLNERGYMGIEKEEKLVKAGIEVELGQNLYNLKKPTFEISSNFEFEKFDIKPDYSIAQSLFTHLPPEMIHDCFNKLAKHVQKGAKFYATFFESKKVITNPDKPHDRLGYWYSREEIEDFGNQNGWEVNYIGDWNHPRGQKIIEYFKA